VFVTGAPASGVESVEQLLAHLGLTSLSASPTARDLYALNDRILEAASGSRDELPEVDPARLSRSARPFLEEARRLLARTLADVGPRSTVPWAWGEPALSILAPFWEEVIGEGRTFVVHVYRRPSSVVIDATARDERAAARGLARWGAYNRSALMQVSEPPVAIANWEDLAADPKRGVKLMAEIVTRCGLAPSAAQCEDALATLEGASSRIVPAKTVEDDVPRPLVVLCHILDGATGLHTGSTWALDASLMEEMGELYDDAYYESSCSGGTGVPYRWSQPYWVNFFQSIAQTIVDSLHPSSVLDAGCAIGLLVEPLRSLGVDARGIDVSPWAIGQVPSLVRPYCVVASITDELTRHYDLITCIEVLEHLPAFVAEAAIANLCRHTDAVLLSATPDDFAEPTHLNVRSAGYWAKLFLRSGFVRDADYDARFIAPHAVLFRRGDVGVAPVVENYEAALERTSARLRQQRDELAQHLRDVEHARSDLEQRQQVLASELASVAANLDYVVNSRSYRYLAPTRRVYAWLRNSALVRAEYRLLRNNSLVRRLYREFRKRSPASRVGGPRQVNYAKWVQIYDTLDESDRQRLRDRIAALSDPTLFSVLLPTYNTPPRFLSAAIDSVRSQLYPHWELCIADDHSNDPEVARILEEYTTLDERIRVVHRSENGHISAATNSALELARGSWVCFLDHDDTYAEHALALLALEAAVHPEADMLYSDEDKIDEAGQRQDPYFKPDFDPLLLLGQNYLCHLLAVRRDLVEKAGRLQEGFEGSQDWDLVLRVTELIEPDHVVHIPHVLYHWRAHAGSTAGTLAAAAKPYAADAGQRAVREHLARTGRATEVSATPCGQVRVRWQIPDPAPRVTIIVPTRDGRYLARCIDSLLASTTYPNFEVVVIDNGSEARSTLSYLDAKVKRGQLRVIRDQRPFNFSALNNMAVARTAGDAVCLLNDDTEVTDGTWLDEMVGQLCQPGVGAVGAKLDYDDGRVQHAGVILGIGGVAGHAHLLVDRHSSGYMGRLDLAQHFSAVTAACMVVRREAWEAVGGFDEDHLAVAFNDVDFCLRLREAGWRIVWTPQAELIHHESATRGSEVFRQKEFAAEISYMQNRWGSTLLHDPAYNPNLTLVSHDWSPASPPRVTYR